MDVQDAVQFLDGARDAELERFDAQENERELLASVLVENEQLAALLREAREQIAALQKERLVLREQLMTDELTGVGNRKAFDDGLKSALARASRTGEHVGLLYVDVDSFKGVNDLGGHAFGDVALQKVAQSLVVAARRSGDLAVRLGGDEFAVVVMGTDLAAARERAVLIRDHLADLNVQRPDGFPLTVSIGVSSTAVRGLDEAALLVGADTALYEAKAAGRDGIGIDERDDADVDADDDMILDGDSEVRAQGERSIGTSPLMRVDHKAAAEDFELAEIDKGVEVALERAAAHVPIAPAQTIAKPTTAPLPRKSDVPARKVAM